MGVKIIVNGFFEPSILFADDYDCTVTRFKKISELVDMEYKPLLADSGVFVLDVFDLSKRDIKDFIDKVRLLHKDNVLCLFTDQRCLLDLKSALVENGIKAEYVNGKYLPMPMFDRYCSGLGLYLPKVIDTLYKRLYGNLDSAQLVIVKYLQTNDAIEKLVAPRVSRFSTNYLAEFLGINQNSHARRDYGRVLRDEHPNYMRAILRSQLRTFIDFKESENKIKHGSYDYRERNVSKRFFELYASNVRLFSLFTLQDINKRLLKCKSSADILLLEYQIKQGGMSFEQEAVFVRYPDVI